MISRFFIDRPIFAAVLSIVITLAGGIAGYYLPIAQYPQITPPSVQVTITYPGASAQVVADTVAAPIEQQVNGVEGMLYMSSQMGNDGSYSLAVTFDVGTDLNTALVMVQNRVALAMPQLPTAVQNQGIAIRKRTPDILMICNLYSPQGRYDDLYLSNFAMINVRDELLRVDGVSDAIIFGERDYSIRAWLDPQKMASCGINAGDVAAAIGSQNIDAPAGLVGQPPTSSSQPFEVPIDTLGRLSDPEQFGNIIVKVSQRNPTATSAAATTSPQVSTALPNPLAAASAQNLAGSAGSLALGGTTLGNTAINGSAISGSLISGTTISGAAIGSVSSATSNATNTTTTGPSGSSSTDSSGSGTSGGASSGGGGTTGGGAMSGGGASTTSPLGGLQINTGTADDTGAIGASVSGTNTSAAAVRRPPRPSTAIVRLRDVARVEMGALNYNQAQTFDGHQSVGIAVFQLPGTNALDIADRVARKMRELKARFPEGVDYAIAYDTTPFIRESVADVVRTLFEAVFLVGLVVLVFLQTWRTVLIPMVAVPVAIVGTFAVMAVVGFSLNNISLFGLVLAIGIVVDDAIVVVENVERWLERGLEPREATRKAMDEVTGPIIAVALVLCAVFVPCAFISGITGRFFRQFAVTIAVSTVFSALNSLTLSPALSAILLQRRGVHRDPLTRLLQGLLGWFFRGFERAFGAGTAGYAWVVGKLLRVNLLVLLVYGALLGVTYLIFKEAPTGFVPQQDQGRVLASVQLPDAASLQRAKAVMAQVEQIALRTPGVAHTLTVIGFSFVQQANGSNFGSIFITLDPFDKRRSPQLRDTAIMNRLRQQWARQIKDAQVLVFGAPPIPGLSVAGGFKLMVEDRGGLGLPTLEQQSDHLIQKLQQQPGLVGVSTQFRSKIPQLFMDIDRTKVASLGISLNDVNQTLQIYLGSLYVNSFNAFGRHWQVTVQAQGADRNRIADINLLRVRNGAGQMVSLGTLVNVREIGGPIFVNRYNLYTCASVTGNLRPGVSSGEVIAGVDRLANQTLPLSMKTEWTELMFMQIRAGNTAMYVFALAVMCVFLALSALYESWSLPLVVILVVPLCLLFSVVGVLATHDSVNIFVQIGLVVLVGLACKNAILVVEFAKQLHQEGQPRFEATVEASRLRLRPILMTSFAFILGVVPLVIASGAGSEMRRSLGTAVFSGMLGVTIFGIFLTPVFFYVIQGLGETRLFTAATTRWVGSIVLGGLVGWAAGALLAAIGVAHLPGVWTPIVGACAGVLAALFALGLHHTIRARMKDEGEMQNEK
jgi:multidrug efflux pump